MIGRWQCLVSLGCLVAGAALAAWLPGAELVAGVAALLVAVSDINRPCRALTVAVLATALIIAHQFLPPGEPSWLWAGSTIATVWLVLLFGTLYQQRIRRWLNANDNYWLAVSAASVGVFQCDLESWELQLDRSLSTMLHGNNAPAMTLNEAMDYLHTDDHKAIIQHIEQLRLGETDRFEAEFRLAKPKGTVRWMLCQAIATTDSRGRRFMHGTVTDVTARKASDDKFRILFECSADAHLLLDETGFLDCNEAAVRMLNCPDKDALLRSDLMRFCPDHQPDGEASAEKAPKLRRQTYQQGTNRFDWLMRRWDGQEVPVEATLTKVELFGQPVLLAVWHDLTDRYRAEEAVRLNEQRLHKLVKNLPAGAVHITDGQIYMNRAAELITGYSPEELPTIQDWFTRLYGDRSAEIYRDYLKNKADGFVNTPVCEIRRKDGQSRFVEFGAYTDAQMEIWLMTDVTERTRASKRVRELARALDCTAEAVFITDSDGCIQYVNPAFTEITGWTADEALGCSPRLLQSGYTPRKVYRQMWEQLSQQKTWQGRILNRRKPAVDTPESEDNLFWAHLTISPVFDGERPVAYIATQRDVTREVNWQRQVHAERNEARIRAAVSQVLHGKEPLESRLQAALEKVLQLDTPDLQYKGAVFLREPSSQHLRLAVTVGKFSPAFMQQENLLPLGECLCGRAARSGKLSIADDCTCDSLTPEQPSVLERHGHYAIPLQSGGMNLGVLFLFAAPYPEREPARLGTLTRIAEMMALAVANDHAQRRLVEAGETARQANDSKSQFLANMSHEIRTPLTAILGYAEMLAESTADTENRGRVQVIQRNGEHLLALINDILDVSKIEAGKLEIESVPVSPFEVLGEVQTLMVVRAEEKGLKLSVSVDGKLPERIITDPTRLKQILVNLVGNAIKFTGSGEVRLIGRYVPDRESPQLEFEVRDTGIGMSPQQVSRLFQPFTQADSSTTRQFGGTGLGLAISKRLSERLGGTIRVHSEPRRGTTFFVRVAAGPLNTTRLVTGVPTAQKPRPAAAVQIQLNSRILLAEDGPDNQRLISHILRKAGAQVVVVSNGQQAVEAALEALDIGEPFDVILMDMQMPVLDGYSATRQLRLQGYRLPIVALTANAMRGDREKCLSAGCDAFSGKPIKKLELFELIQYQHQRAREILAVK